MQELHIPVGTTREHDLMKKSSGSREQRVFIISFSSLTLRIPGSGCTEGLQMLILVIKITNGDK